MEKQEVSWKMHERQMPADVSSQPTDNKRRMFDISALPDRSTATNVVLKRGQGGRDHHSKVWPPVAQRMQCQMVALGNVCARHQSLSCILSCVFSDAGIEFDFVLMTSAYTAVITLGTVVSSL